MLLALLEVGGALGHVMQQKLSRMRSVVQFGFPMGVFFLSIAKRS